MDDALNHQTPAIMSQQQLHGLPAEPRVPSYRAPRWLRGGHRQTIYASKALPIPDPGYRRAFWRRGAGASLSVKWIDALSPKAPLVVLFHGLGGGGGSHYARGLAWSCQKRGWGLAIPEFGNENLHLASDEMSIAGAIPRLLAHLSEDRPGSPVFVLGVSFGALPLLHWLAHDADRAQRIVTAAAAISAPIDFEGSTRRIMSDGLPLYKWNFVRCLTATPPATRRQQLRETAARGMEDIRERTGFLPRALSDYLDAFASWGAWRQNALAHIVTPTLLLNAKNDPCLSEACFPRPDEVAPAVRVEYPDQGGHVGFVTGGFPGSFDWLPMRVMHFFSSFGGLSDVPAPDSRSGTPSSASWLA